MILINCRAHRMEDFTLNNFFCLFAISVILYTRGTAFFFFFLSAQRRRNSKNASDCVVKNEVAEWWVTCVRRKYASRKAINFVPATRASPPRDLARR